MARGTLAARHDLVVDLHGDATGDAERVEELRDRAAGGRLAGLTIDDYEHVGHAMNRRARRDTARIGHDGGHPALTGL